MIKAGFCKEHYDVLIAEKLRPVAVVAAPVPPVDQAAVTVAVAPADKAVAATVPAAEQAAPVVAPAAETAPAPETKEAKPADEAK